METEDTTEQAHEGTTETVTETAVAVAPAVVAAAPVAPVAEQPKVHAPTCSKCDEAAVQAEQPTTGDRPFRLGFCEAHKDEKPVKTIEAWAAAKGMLPRILDAGDVQMKASVVRKAGPGNKRAIQVSAVHRGSGSKPGRQNPKFEAFHVARAHHGWLPGTELTEEAFDAAVVKAKTEPKFF